MVVLNGRRMDALDGQRGGLRAKGWRVEAVAFVTDPQSVHRGVETIEQDIGANDVLVTMPASSTASNSRISRLSAGRRY